MFRDRENKAKDWEVSDTLKLAGISLVGQVALLRLAKTAGLELGNPGAKQFIKYLSERPFFTTAMAVGVAPPLEEAVFRYIPSKLADNLQPSEEDSSRWALGALTSAAFAGVHQIGTEKKHIPASQFVAGMTNWYIHRRGGYGHAVLAHTLQNTVAVSVALAAIKFDKLPEELRPVPEDT